MEFTFKIGVVGLGYVGLPLAIAFSKKYQVVGLDINATRITELTSGHDSTLEVEPRDLKNSKVIFTADSQDLKGCDFIIVTVPTPVTSNKLPDLSPLIAASSMIGRILEHNVTVIYESTVYPGATEEVCVPVLEKESTLRCNKDFFVGYSPERINPGDKEHRINDIIKVTSGSTPEIAEKIDQLYGSIISAGTHKASSIKVAEAAKVIENTQRDVNIALINELSIIFNSLEIDTEEVLNAAGTKWNFLPFRPGLVGGHCIGVDPYYLTYKSEQVGYSPEIILAGRRLNDGMGKYIANQLSQEMSRRAIKLVDARVLVMGLTFKENCPDMRNTKVIDIIDELSQSVHSVECYDPWVNEEAVKDQYQINQIKRPDDGRYDAIVLAVSHQKFHELGLENIRKFGKSEHVLYDLKYLFSKEETDLRL
jgi:UDP-N-acetyl-D-glucosamine/UDP-N-acetyl-D-galactosamine dehydrogenase|tara:strand:+ start:1040 stop:2308 length:1269 start_codon:yes stop_codon:yes gene_type:complete